MDQSGGGELQESGLYGKYSMCLLDYLTLYNSAMKNKKNESDG